MSEYAVSIDQVIYEYQNETFHFDLKVEAGSIVALMGPSGSGKSTLLSLIAGFIDPKSGVIQVDGVPVIGLQPNQRPLAMLFQEHNLFSHLTVRQNIGLGLHPGLKLTPKQERQVEEAASQVGISELLDRRPEQLSGGQRQRVALARCFVQPHSIWLLDEPFSALDPVLRDEMLKLVKRLSKERSITVIMVTHHISDAKSIASHFAFMEQGRVSVEDQIQALELDHSNSHLVEFLKASGY